MNALDRNLIKRLDTLDAHLECKNDIIKALENENKRLRAFIESEMLCVTPKEIALICKNIT